jgi:hypothetical protein
VQDEEAEGNDRLRLRQKTESAFKSRPESPKLKVQSLETNGTVFNVSKPSLILAMDPFIAFNQEQSRPTTALKLLW